MQELNKARIRRMQEGKAMEADYLEVLGRTADRSSVSELNGHKKNYSPFKKVAPSEK